MPQSVPAAREGPVRIFPYALSRDSMERVIRDLRLEARTVGGPEQADMIVAMRARAEDGRLKRILAGREVPLYLIKGNTTAQMRRVLRNVFHVLESLDEEESKEAVSEVEHAIQRVFAECVEVALAPRPSAMRKMQHRIITRHLAVDSAGREPMRHLVVHPRDCTKPGARSLPA